MDSNGRVKEVKYFFDEATSLFGGFGAKKPWTHAIIDVGFPGVNKERLAPIFAYIKFSLKQVVSNNKLPDNGAPQRAIPHARSWRGPHP